MRLRVCDEESGSEAWSRRFFCSGRGQKEEKTYQKRAGPLKKRRDKSCCYQRRVGLRMSMPEICPPCRRQQVHFFFLLEACEAIIKRT